jgi:hypothetical protein
VVFVLKAVVQFPGAIQEIPAQDVKVLEFKNPMA